LALPPPLSPYGPSLFHVSALRASIGYRGRTVMLRKLRRKVADFILGDDIVLFAPKRYIEALKLDDYSSMPDVMLAAATRRWFAACGQARVKMAMDEAKPMSVFLAQSSVLSLARIAHDVNAETASYHISGSVDGGKTLEDFLLVLTRKPHDDADWEEDAPPVEQVEEGGKIKSLTYRIRMHESFERWLQERAAERVSSGEAA
jgi:hypothetical protein